MNPSQRYLKKYQAKIAENDQIIAGQKLEIQQLKDHADVLKLKNNRLFDNIRQKLAREEATLNAKHQAKCSELRDEVKLLNQELESLKTHKIDLDSNLVELEAKKKTAIEETSSLNDTIKQHKNEVLDLTRQIDRFSNELNTLKTRRDEIYRDIADAESNIDDKKQLHHALGQEIEQAKVKIEELENQFNNQKSELDKKIQELNSRLYQKIKQLKDIANKDKEMRQSLASEQVRLEKREAVIKRREMIVAVDEEKIKNNMDILKL